MNQSEFNHKDTKSIKKNLDFFVSFVTLWFLKTYDLRIETSSGWFDKLTMHGTAS